MELDLSSLRQSNRCFPYTFSDDQINRLSAAKFRLHKRTSSGELPVPRILAADIVSWAIDELNQCVIPDVAAYLGSHLRPDEVTRSCLLMHQRSFSM